MPNTKTVHIKRVRGHNGQVSYVANYSNISF